MEVAVFGEEDEEIGVGVKCVFVCCVKTGVTKLHHTQSLFPGFVYFSARDKQKRRYLLAPPYGFLVSANSIAHGLATRRLVFVY